MQCFYKDCRKSVSMIGNCKYCTSMYCLKHRLPESHECAGLDKLKQACFETAVKEIKSNRCVRDKI